MTTNADPQLLAPGAGFLVLLGYLVVSLESRPLRFGAEMFRNKHAAIRPAVRAMSDTGLVTGSKPNVSAVEPELPPAEAERATDLAVTGQYW